jgi:thiamine-phosphate pyrophosphorylase
MSRLSRAATALGRAGGRGKPGSRLPALWLVTDPARLADPLAAARNLPRGAGLIYRAFGAADALVTAQALRRIAWRRGLVFLVGADPRLAADAGADGVHLPERDMRHAIQIRKRHPRWRISAAAHSRGAILQGDRLGLDAMLVSAVFPSRSLSAVAALGPQRFAALIRGAHTPVIALGGVNNETAPRLVGTGAAGLAAVDGLSART